jgi:hypothetical protein
MSAELELAAWDIDGTRLWSQFVEPPWTYSVEGRLVTLEVMGTETTFDLRTDRPSPAWAGSTRGEGQRVNAATHLFWRRALSPLGVGNSWKPLTWAPAVWG